MGFELTDLALGRALAHRHAELRTDNAWWQRTSASVHTRVIATNQAMVAVNESSLKYVSPADVADTTLAYLGEYEGIHYATVLDDLDAWPSDWQWENLRHLGQFLNALESGLATSAVALSNWHRNHTHCPRCGAQTFVSNAGWVRQCPSDGSEHYPRMDNAVIVNVIDKDDRILLARQTVWAENHYSIVAGFVEPGETFEAAVAREVLEETGIAIANPQILGNQPWPFPASMMLGFTADALNTEITVDGTEIAHAQWFSREELIDACARNEVQLPTRTSIARRLIEHWYGAEISDEFTRR
ncbi:MAG: diphosphatase [Actinomycetota bacterium]|jgi:NAD+ diphosphatase